MAGTLPQATEPSTASPAVAGGGAAPDGYTRCEVLIPASSKGVESREKQKEPSRRLREAMGLTRKRRGAAAEREGGAAPARRTAPATGPLPPVGMQVQNSDRS